MRVANWYRRMDLKQKVVFGVAVAVALFLGSLWGSVLLVSLLGAGDDENASGAARPSETQATASTGPEIEVRIRSARWKGERVVVDGTWRGDLSSVHCDLFEGRNTGRVTDWWDRGVAARASWSRHIFEQDFVRAKGRKIENPIDPSISYSVVCSGMFSGGVSAGVPTAVAGTPPG